MNKKGLVFKTVLVTSVMMISVCTTACGSEQTSAPAVTVEQSLEAEAPSTETYARLELRNTDVKVSIGSELKAENLVVKAENMTGYRVAFSDDTTEKVISSYDLTGDTLTVTYPDGTSYDLSFTIEVQDSVSPEILGVHDIEVVEGADINLLDGITASDDRDGDLTSSIGVSDYDSSLFDVAQKIVYSVADLSGNVFETEANLTIVSNPLVAMDKVMYATADVNVRDASSAEGNKVGSVGYAQAVQVLAQDKNTGWYQIKNGDGVGFVSDKYLSDTKPAPKPAPVQKSSGGTQKSSGGAKSSSGQQSQPQSQPQAQTPSPAPAPTPAPSSGDSSSGGIRNPSAEEQARQRTGEKFWDHYENGWD